MMMLDPPLCLFRHLQPLVSFPAPAEPSPQFRPVLRYRRGIPQTWTVRLIRDRYERTGSQGGDAALHPSLEHPDKFPSAYRAPPCFAGCREDHRPPILSKQFDEAPTIALSEEHGTPPHGWITLCSIKREAGLACARPALSSTCVVSNTSFPQPMVSRESSGLSPLVQPLRSLNQEGAPHYGSTSCQASQESRFAEPPSIFILLPFLNRLESLRYVKLQVRIPRTHRRSGLLATYQTCHLVYHLSPICL